jgi:purine-nucleoside phosphorylase
MLNLEKNLFEAVKESSKFIKKYIKITKPPTIGIVLGTGLGQLVKNIKESVTIPYEKIPNFPKSTAQSHAGRLIIGKIQNIPVIVMQGRFHYYEGYTLKQVTFPIRVLKYLGIKTLIISNASGGVNPKFKVGDFMLIKDHINLLPSNTLIGLNDPRLGARSPDMSEPYSKRLRKIAKEKSKSLKISIHEGVYVSVTGLSYETRAEAKALRVIGADSVGMSTVPETIVAVQAGLEVMGISVITDDCTSERKKILTSEDIIKTAEKAEPKLTKLIETIIPEI